LRVEGQQLQEKILRHLGAPCHPPCGRGLLQGCDLEIHALNNAYYNIEGWASVVASRAMLTCCVTGAVSRTWKLRSSRTYDACLNPGW